MAVSGSSLHKVAALICLMAIARSAWPQDSPLLAGIDAPEFKQPGGTEARLALLGRIVGEEVTLNVVVYFGDENINGWLVKQGHAWAYRQAASRICNGSRSYLGE